MPYPAKGTYSVPTCNEQESRFSLHLHPTSPTILFYSMGMIILSAFPVKTVQDIWKQLKFEIQICMCMVRQIYYSMSFISTVCPTPCRCPSLSKGRLVLDCRNSKLRAIPDNIPITVVAIDLSANFIAHVSDDSFKNCANVTTLDLTFNMISFIQNSMLRGMPHLEEIVLDRNLLWYNETSFPGAPFADLQHLISISIQSQGTPHSPSPKDFETMMHKLPTILAVLFFDIPVENGFSLDFAEAKKLTKLGIRIGKRSGHQNPVLITNDTFRLCVNLSITELRITARNLSEVQPLAFYYLPKLRSLDMSETYGMSIADLSSALKGLRNTKLEKLRLSHMFKYKHRSELVVLNGTFCANLVLPHLTDLQMDHTQLYDVTRIPTSETCFSNLVNLKRLNVSSNFISLNAIQRLFQYDLTSSLNLIEIDISHQYDLTIGVSRKPLWLQVNPGLKIMHMSSVRRANVGIPFEFHIDSATSVEYLNFQNNRVERLSIFDIDRSTTSTPITVDFSRNNMISFAGSFDQSILEKGLLVCTLLLHWNKLGEELSKHGDTIFRNFKDLKELDLTLNEIKTLPYSTFKNQEKIEVLNLSKNSLVLLNVEISHLKHLETIDLSDNLMSHIDETRQHELETRRHSFQAFTVNMLGNPIQCSCENFQFLSWMYNQRMMFVQYDNYTCVYANEVIYFKNMKTFIGELHFQCSLDSILKICAGLLAFTIAVFVVSYIIHRHKWDVRFFCLKFVANRKAYQELEEDAQAYEYDAFVAYHESDKAWVYDLYEHIDKKEGVVESDSQTRFKLCIHHRDFQPGVPIEENILRTIDSSRKVIAVLSERFFESRWCEFELELARMECIEKGRNLLIAVMLEPLPNETNLPRCVKKLICRNTYIAWPEDAEEREYFWDQLREALRN